MNLLSVVEFNNPHLMKDKRIAWSNRQRLIKKLLRQFKVFGQSVLQTHKQERKMTSEFQAEEKQNQW